MKWDMGLVRTKRIDIRETRNKPTNCFHDNDCPNKVHVQRVFRSIEELFYFFILFLFYFIFATLHNKQFLLNKKSNSWRAFSLDVDLII